MLSGTRMCTCYTSVASVKITIKKNGRTHKGTGGYRIPVQETLQEIVAHFSQQVLVYRTGF